MTDAERIEVLKAKNEYLLKEVSAMAAESVKREVQLAKLEAEVLRMREVT